MTVLMGKYKQWSWWVEMLRDSGFGLWKISRVSVFFSLSVFPELGYKLKISLKKTPTLQQPNKNLQIPPPLIFTLYKNLKSIYTLYLNKDFYKYPKVFLVTHYFKNVKIGISKPFWFFFPIQHLTKVFQRVCWIMVLFKIGDFFAFLSLMARPQQVLGTVQCGDSQQPAWPSWLAALIWTKVDQVCVSSEMVSLLLHSSVDTAECKAEWVEESQCNCTGLQVQLWGLCYPAKLSKKWWRRWLKALSMA